MTSACVTEQKYIFNRQLALGNEMRRMIWKFTLGMSQREPSQLKVGWLLMAWSQKELELDQREKQTRKSVRSLDRLSKTKESGLDFKVSDSKPQNVCVCDKTKTIIARNHPK